MCQEVLLLAVQEVRKWLRLEVLPLGVLQLLQVLVVAHAGVLVVAPNFTKASSSFLAASLKNTYEESPMPKTANCVSARKCGRCLQEGLHLLTELHR